MDWCSDTKLCPSDNRIDKNDAASLSGGINSGNAPPDCVVSSLKPEEKMDEQLPRTLDATATVDSIDDDEHDDEFSFANLDLRETPLEYIRPRREIQLVGQPASGCQTYWRCSQCEILNVPKSRFCSTCRYQFDDERRTSNMALLERTRYELLNGRDFWICTHCVIAIPSITMPCGKCKRMISFVPLEIGEFEEFVRKQRGMGWNTQTTEATAQEREERK